MSRDTAIRYYFAYGSNLCLDQMQRRCPGARPAGVVRLDRHRLTFPLLSRTWGAGVAGIEPHETEFVEGVLYELTDDHFASLDRYEGSYTRDVITVICPRRGEIEAMVYRPNRNDGPFAPSSEYLATMLRGAEAHGLSPAWIELLKRINA